MRIKAARAFTNGRRSRRSQGRQSRPGQRSRQSPGCDGSSARRTGGLAPACACSLPCRSPGRSIPPFGRKIRTERWKREANIYETKHFTSSVSVVHDRGENRSSGRSRERFTNFLAGDRLRRQIQTRSYTHTEELNLSSYIGNSKLNVLSKTRGCIQLLAKCCCTTEP